MAAGRLRGEEFNIDTIKGVIDGKIYRIIVQDLQAGDTKAFSERLEMLYGQVRLCQERLCPGTARKKAALQNV